MSRSRKLIAEAVPDWTPRDRPPDIGPAISWLAGIIKVESPGTKIDWVTIGALQNEAAAVELIRLAERVYPSRVIDSAYGTPVFSAIILKVNRKAARDRLRVTARRLKPSRVVILVETSWASDGMVIITDDSVEKIQRKLTAAKTMEESVSGWRLEPGRITISSPVYNKEAAISCVAELIHLAAPSAVVQGIRTPRPNSDNFSALLDAGYKQSAIFCSSVDIGLVASDSARSDERKEDLHRRFCVAVSHVGQDVSHAYVIRWTLSEFAMTVLFTNDSFDKLMRKIAAASAMTEHLSAGN